MKKYCTFMSAKKRVTPFLNNNLFIFFAMINIAIANHHVVYRQALAYLLNDVENFTVCIEASSGDDLIRQINAGPQLPDLCIFDIMLAPENGYITIKKLKGKWPGLKVWKELRTQFYVAKWYSPGVQY